MIRPCFLVVDREFSGSISTRKLVIETAKFNVLTAYSSAEALDMLQRFPAVSGIVLDAGMTDMPCEKLVNSFKAIQASIPVIVVSHPKYNKCVGADYHIEGFEPGAILKLLQGLKPQESAAIEKQNEILSAESQ